MSSPHDDTPTAGVGPDGATSSGPLQPGILPPADTRSTGAALRSARVAIVIVLTAAVAINVFLAWQAGRALEGLQRRGELVEQEETLLRARLDQVQRDRLVGLIIGAVLIGAGGLIAWTLMARGQRALELSERRQRTAAEAIAAAEQRSAFLAEASRQLAGSLDYELTLANVADLAVPALADWCFVDVVEDDGRIRRVGVAHADPAMADVARELRRFPPDPNSPRGIPQVLRTGQPALLPHIDEAFLRGATRDEEHFELARAFGPRSGMIVPMLARGRTLGAITLYSVSPERHFGPDDLSLAEELARRAAIAVDNARLYRAELRARQAAERAAERIAGLQAVTAALSETLTPAEVVEVVVRHGIAALGATAGLVALLADDAELELVRAVGYPEDPLATWRRVSVMAPLPLPEAVRTGDLVLVESPRAGTERFPELAEVQAGVPHGAWAAIPLVVEGHAAGAMELAFAEPRAFDQDDRAVMLALGRQCAQALERARLYEAEGRARQAAEAAELRYRSLFEGAPDAIVVFDDQGRVIDANPAFLDLLACSEEALRDLRLDGATFTVDGQPWAELAYDHLLRDGSWRGELEVRCCDGSIVPAEALWSAVRLPDRTAYRAALRDVSERRALERLQQEFLAMVSHELRNPLTALSGFAQVMQREGSYNERVVTMILNQARQLERLIGDLLEVSRLEAGRLELQRTEMDLVQLVRTEVERTQGLARKHTVRVVAPDRPIVGQWDRDRLEQVLHNLLSNAVKYSPKGGEILVRVESDEREARVSVTDQGVGIAPEILPHLFDRFYRAEATAGGAKGLGLGLYVSRSLIEAHGGRLSVESTPSEGSTFTITLPKDE